MSSPVASKVLVLRLSLDVDYHEGKEQLLAAYEREFLRNALNEANFNLSRASRDTGMSRKHLRTLMQKHGMQITRSVEGARPESGERFFAVGTASHVTATDPPTGD